MATFKAIVFQTGRHIKQDGTSNIKIRIYHNRESQYIVTSYYIRPENMDASGRILPNVPNSEMIEYEINAYIQKIRREYLKPCILSVLRSKRAVEPATISTQCRYISRCSLQHCFIRIITANDGTSDRFESRRFRSYFR